MALLKNWTNNPTLHFPHSPGENGSSGAWESRRTSNRRPHPSATRLSRGTPVLRRPDCPHSCVYSVWRVLWVPFQSEMLLLLHVVPAALDPVVYSADDSDRETAWMTGWWTVDEASDRPGYSDGRGLSSQLLHPDWTRTNVETTRTTKTRKQQNQLQHNRRWEAVGASSGARMSHASRVKDEGRKTADGYEDQQNRHWP